MGLTARERIAMDDRITAGLFLIFILCLMLGGC